MGVPYGIGARRISGMAYSTVSKFWQLGNLGTPNPVVPNDALDVPGWVFTNALPSAATPIYQAAQVRAASYSEGGSPSVVVTKPTGTADRDLLIAVIRADNGTTPDLPSGFTAHSIHVSGGGRGTVRVCYKIASGEGADYTLTVPSGAMQATVLSIVGYDPAQPLETDAVQATATSAVRSNGNVITARPASLFLCFTDGLDTYTTPGDWAVVAGSGDTFASTFQRSQAAMPLGGAITMTQAASSVWHMVTIAVRPSLRPPSIAPSLVTLESSGAVFTAVGVANSHSFSPITVGAGSNRCLLVWIGLNANTSADVSGVTWNGSPMTSLGAIGTFGDQRFSLWRIVNPATGNNTLAISYNLTADVGEVVLWASLQGVDQTTPLSATATDLDTGNNPTLTAAPTGVSGGYPLAGIVGWDSDGTCSFTTNGDGTRLASSSTAIPFAGALDTEPPAAGAQSFSITVNTGAAYDAAMIAVVALPATAFATELAFPALDYMKSRFQHLMVR